MIFRLLFSSHKMSKKSPRKYPKSDPQNSPESKKEKKKHDSGKEDNRSNSKEYGQSQMVNKILGEARMQIGVPYKLQDHNLIASLEFENSSYGTNYIRFGVEYNLFSGLYIRGGLDKLNLSNTNAPSNPSLGFSYFYTTNNLVLGVNYAFVIEPYSSSDRHIIGIDINF